MKVYNTISIVLALGVFNLAIAAPAQEGSASSSVEEWKKPSKGIKGPKCPVCLFKCPDCEPCGKKEGKWHSSSKKDSREGYEGDDSDISRRQVTTGPYAGCPKCECPKCPRC